MKKRILSIVLCGTILISCDSSDSDETINIEAKVGEVKMDTAQFIKQVEEIESKLNTTAPDKKDLILAASLFEKYATIFPEDAKSAGYLLKASDFNLAIGKVQKSVYLLNLIIDNYPNYSKLESVYFNRANHTDFDLRDTSSAKTYYHEFLEKFPESAMAETAENRIKNIALSMEDLVKQFEKMNAEK